MIVKTLSDAGTPICPVCETDVEKEGHFDSVECWERFHIVIFESNVPMIDMTYVDLEDQPWYDERHDDHGQIGVAW